MPTGLTGRLLCGAAIVAISGCAEISSRQFQGPTEDAESPAQASVSTRSVEEDRSGIGRLIDNGPIAEGVARSE